jgi:hypothetical protein
MRPAKRAHFRGFRARAGSCASTFRLCASKIYETDEGPLARPLGPVTSVGVVEALPARPEGGPAARNAGPLRWLGGSRSVPGARLYPLVPPLPELSSLKSDHLLSAVPSAYASAADSARPGRTNQVTGASLRSVVSSSPRSSGTVTLETLGSRWRAAEYAASGSAWDRTLSATTRPPASSSGRASA